MAEFGTWPSLQEEEKTPQGDDEETPPLQDSGLDTSDIVEDVSEVGPDLGDDVGRDLVP